MLSCFAVCWGRLSSACKGVSCVGGMVLAVVRVLDFCMFCVVGVKDFPAEEGETQ